MRVGLYMDLRNPPQWRRPWETFYGRQLEVVEEAERLGAHSVWLSEHHFFEDGYLTQPLTFAAAIAARTQRVRIGTAVLLSLLRPTVQVAEDAAMVDLLSGGRLELGLGTGYRGPEFEAFGAATDRKWDRLDAQVVELRRLWAEKVTPPPLQRPIPIWLGYSGPKGARRAGLLDAGLVSFLHPRLVEPYLAGLAEAGLGPERARMSGLINMVVAEDPEATWPRVRDHWAYQWNSYRRYMVEGTGAPEPRPLDPEAFRKRGDPPCIQVLTPEQAVESVLADTAGMPVVEVFFWSSLAGMPDDVAEEHLRLLFGRVSPALAERTVTKPATRRG